MAVTRSNSTANAPSNIKPNKLWKGIVGKSFDVAGFETYCKGLVFDTWKPEFIVLHNTGTPSLAQRPKGLTQQHITNLEVFYRDVQQWSAGPHLFVDDRQIWVFTPLTTPGVHSPSWNSKSWGIEMLGDYETESFDKGRGAKVRKNAISAINILDKLIGLSADSLRLHHEDPKTTHKCPGKNVVKGDVIELIEAIA